MDLNNLTEEEVEFLQESNAIEGVYDDDSLQQAIYAWEYLKTKKKIDTHAILKAHKILMLHQRLAPNEKGYWRTIPVYIGGRKCDVKNADGWPLETVMSQWCFNINRDNWTGIGPVGMHIQFERIHPFVDGNGRVGRMLMNWQMLKMKRPILIIKEAEKQTYYRWFSPVVDPKEIQSKLFNKE